jgi:quercetin dioxygenase-like cupin family protein
MPDQYRIQRWSGEQEPDAAELREVLCREGYSVYSWTDRPGAVYDWHTHGEDQSHWVVSGSIELDVTGFGTVVLGPGDRDFMPAGTYHAARVVGGGPVSYLIGQK